MKVYPSVEMCECWGEPPHARIRYSEDRHSLPFAGQNEGRAICTRDFIGGKGAKSEDMRTLFTQIRLLDLPQESPAPVKCLLGAEARK